MMVNQDGETLKDQKEKDEYATRHFGDIEAAKYMDTGSYLRPHDMQFCVERTKFAEEKIVAWFKRFRLRIFPATY